MGRVVGSIVLFVLSLSMFFGFMRSGAAIGAPTTLMALLVTVVLPAAGGVALLAGRYRTRGRLAARRDQLRQKTLESEILRLAGERDGRLTSVEVVSEMAVSPEEAKETLDSLVTREVADIQITDRGLLVYTFHDIRQLGDKARAKGVLDA